MTRFGRDPSPSKEMEVLNRSCLAGAASRKRSRWIPRQPNPAIFARADGLSGSAPMSVLWRGSVVQRLQARLPGLVLFTFVLTHFLNHARRPRQPRRDDRRRSLADRDDALDARHAWCSLAALLVHLGLAILRIAGHAKLALAAWQWTQIGFGFAIPLLLFPHIVARASPPPCSASTRATPTSWRESGRPPCWTRRCFSSSSGCMAASACISG